jgi:hypothetical protein
MKVQDWFAVFACISLLGGCTRPYRTFDPIAHHTVKATADTENDVVWIQEVDIEQPKHVLIRCVGSAAATKCERIKTE